MKTMAIGYGTARERPSAGPSMHTHVSSPLPVVSNAPVTPYRGWVNPSGGTIRELTLYNVCDAGLRGGFEWTGRAFPLRIPTTWKRQALRMYRRAKARMYLFSREPFARELPTVAVVLLSVVVMWSVLQASQ